MRVLFVTHAFPRREGDGAGDFILRLAVALRAAGVSVEVLAPSAPGLTPIAEISGVRVTRFRYAPRSWETLAYEGTMAERVAGSVKAKIALLGFIVGARRAVRAAMRPASRPDIIHAHWWFPCGVAAALTPGATPLVVTMHGSDVRLAAKSAVAPTVMSRVLHRAAAVTAVSSWLANTAQAFAAGVPIVVSPMPVDVSRFIAGPRVRKPQLLFVGRLNAQKGLADLIDALTTVREDATLDVVGDGPDRDSLVAQTSRLGISNRVRWHGQLPPAKVAPLYRDACLVVIPSREEGLGLVAAEALLSETAVVAYRSGGIVDLVEDGVTGRLVDEGSISQLGDAINQLLSAPDAATKMGSTGRARMLERFAPQTVAGKYVATYNAVIGR